MSDKQFNLNLQLYKMDEEKRLVYGCAASSDIDSSGEYMEWDRGKQAFIDWSDAVFQRSQGKSYGNVREQHNRNTAAGLLPQPLTFDDNSQKIYAIAEIVDDDAWQKCLKGVYNSFSVGGGYASRIFDGLKQAWKFVPIVKELTLCDLPMNLTCTFELLKSDNTIEVRNFNNIKDVKMSKELVKAAILGDLFKSELTEQLKKAFIGTDSEKRDRIKAALQNVIKVPLNVANSDQYCYVWLKDIYTDRVIFEANIDGDADDDTYQINYNITDAGIVTFSGTPIQVRTDYVPAVDEDNIAPEIPIIEPPPESTTLGKTDTTPNGPDGLENTFVPTDTELQDQRQATTDQKSLADIEAEGEAVMKANTFGELNKAGATHSKEHLEMLKKAHHAVAEASGFHSDAICKCDKCQKCYTGEGAEMQKADIYNTLMKADGIKDLIQTATESMELKKANIALDCRNRELEEELQKFNSAPDFSGAPIINVGAVEKTFTVDELAKGNTQTQVDLVQQAKDDLAKANTDTESDLAKYNIVFAGMNQAFSRPVVLQQQ